MVYNWFINVMNMISHSLGTCINCIWARVSCCVKALVHVRARVGGGKVPFPPHFVFRHNFFVSWWIDLKFSGEGEGDIRRWFPVFLVIGWHMGYLPEGYIDHRWTKTCQNPIKTGSWIVSDGISMVKHAHSWWIDSELWREGEGDIRHRFPTFLVIGRQMGNHPEGYIWYQIPHQSAA